MCVSQSPIEWALPCISRKGDKLPANLPGWLASFADKPAEIHFIARTWRGGVLAALDIGAASIEFRDGFLASRIEIKHREGRPCQGFLFEASLSKAAQELASRLNDDARLAKRSPVLGQLGN